MHALHRAGCGCHKLSRRSFLTAAASVAAVAATGLTGRAFAGGHAAALVVTCMDFRLVDDAARYFAGAGLANNYDQISLAGASVGALGKLNPAWAETFWSHVDAAIQLHEIKRVILLDHRDCGAYKLAFGPDSIAEVAAETALHQAQLGEVKRQLAEKKPDLAFTGLLMGLDGSVEALVLG